MATKHNPQTKKSKEPSLQTPRCPQGRRRAVLQEELQSLDGAHELGPESANVTPLSVNLGFRDAFGHFHFWGDFDVSRSRGLNGRS